MLFLYILFSITMLTKNQSKRIRALAIKKYRENYGEFVAEGDKIIKELTSSNYQIKEIYSTPTWLEKNSHLLPQNCPKFPITLKELKSISRQINPNQALAIVKIPEEKKAPNPENQLTLILDNIQDPGNMGTIIRTAEWFGVKHLICSDDTVDLYNPKVIQSTMGSFCRVEIWYTDLASYLEKYIDKVPIYGSFLDGYNAFNISFPKNAIIVIGNESKGISQKTEKYISKKVTIPPYYTEIDKKPESLNASVATGILLAIMRM